MTRIVAVVVAAFGLTAGSAQAATLKLACAGHGAKNKDSAGTVLCAANPGKRRSVAGTIRNDSGQPVAGTVSVTYSSWTPATGGGYTIKPTSTRQVTAKANGSFTISSNTTTRESIAVALVADPALGIAAAPTATAEVQRRLAVAVRKLGGGSIKLTVKGTKIRPLKVSVTSGGYYVPGIPKFKKADRQGSVTFNLGSRHGKFGYYVDAGIYGDLFWPQSRTQGFRL